MKEAIKAACRRNGDKFWDEVLTGSGLTVGSEESSIKKESYSNITNLESSTGMCIYDLRKFSPNSFDFIYLGECLEHETNLFTAIMSWLYMVKEFGHLVITVPDFILYEKGVWPSLHDKTHKCSFSILPENIVKHNKHYNVIDFLSRLPCVQIRRINLADSNYDYKRSDDDQTRGDAESHIEIVLRKLPFISNGKKTFKHSGARGDLIYSLPAIRTMGGGTVYLNRRQESYFSGKKPDDKELESIRDFMKSQPYIDDVLDWNGENVDVDLDVFRELDLGFILLVSSYLMRFGLNCDISKKWIDSGKFVPVCKADIIVSRTERYNAPFDWKELMPWIGISGFVGTEGEHKEFVRKTGFDIKHVVTKTWKELAEVILGSKLFIGNQSFAYSLAEGMKVPRVLEVCPFCSNCDPKGDDGHVRLSQGVIRKYVLGDKYDDVVRESRSESLQVNFFNKKTVKEGYKDVSCVLVGDSQRTKDFENEIASEGIEVVCVNGKTFESSANDGAKLATRRIICIADVDMCNTKAPIAVVLDGILMMNVGMVSACSSTYGVAHPSGPCLAVTREEYEKAGLFNLSLRSGEAGMLDLFLRYNRLGISCRSLSLQGCVKRNTKDGDRDRNNAYIDRNWGITV